jgi:hypothetical protein
MQCRKCSEEAREGRRTCPACAARERVRYHQRKAEGRYVEGREAKRESKRRRRRAVEAIVRAAKARPCADCGGTFHFAAMQFDHLPGTAKTERVSKMMTSSDAAVRAKMAKCEVVCANCHAVRTWRRRNEG